MDNIDLLRKYDRGTLTDTPASTCSIYFERRKPEVRKVLRKKLHTVKQEKQTLEDIIANKNTEIDELKKSVRCLNELINSVPIDDLRNNSSVAGAKIMELNKRNRVLKSDLECARKKNTVLEAKIQSLQVELKKASSRKSDLGGTERMVSKLLSHRLAHHTFILACEVDTAIEDLQSKLNITKQKLFDSLNQNVELKNQLKIAQKCIQQEIGDNVNLNLLASSAPTWRGRAQQIMTLQLKINELKDQLGSARTEAGWIDECTDEPPVRREQIYHRAEVEVLQKDITSLTNHIDELNQKISALKARNKNLVMEIGKMKEKLANSETVVSNNENVIESLNEKINIQRFHYENKIRDIQKQISSSQKERTNLEFNQEEMKIKMENLQVVIDEKDEQIIDLNGTIKKLEKDLRSVCGDFLFECRNFKKEEFLAMLDALESEKSNLLNLNKTLNERCEDERKRALNLTDQIAKFKIKVCRLEGKIRDLERDQGHQNEKKKRSQRIIDYTNGIQHNISTVSSFVFENSSFTDMHSNHGDADNKVFEIADLKNKLEVSKEKICLLEDKLNYLIEEKQNDAKAFENIIKQSKATFLDAVNRVHETSSHQLIIK